MPTERSPLHDWHRLFGLSWIDFFQNSPIDVQTELDLSLKQQFIDLVLIRKGPEPILRPLPDGFENLAAHNLITFKSYHEALDGWSLSELVGHYVNYRKQSSPSMQELLPESDYRLFAVCARYPLQLSQQVALAAVRDAVYDVAVDGSGVPGAAAGNAGGTGETSADQWGFPETGNEELNHRGTEK